MAQNDWIAEAEKRLVKDNNAIAILSMNAPNKQGEMFIELKRENYLLKPKCQDHAETLMDLWSMAENVWLIKKPKGKVLITDFFTTTIENEVIDCTEKTI